MTSTSLAVDGPTILAHAKDLNALLREEIDAAERRRQLTPRIVDALRASGVFRMAMPSAWGGPEVDILCQVQIIEAISRAYGSAGWCAMIGSDSGFFSASLDEQAARELYGDLDVVTAGFAYPVGRLEVVEDGFQLSGRWSFGSGCTHADVIMCGATVLEDERPVLGSNGKPDWRIALVPATQITILDTWSTTGLAGSGSHDYIIERTFVPNERTFHLGEVKRLRPLYAWPGLFMAKSLGVPLGIARDALDAAVTLLDNKLILPDRKLARDEPRVRAAIAQAQALIGSARSYVFAVLAAFWTTLQAGDPPILRQRAELAGCYRHTFRACLDAVRLLYETTGSAAVYRTYVLDRHLRDLLTLQQHIVAQARLLEIVGGMWFGHEPENPLL
jgi:alkylation response protein AidB-like acyl-CoA dehydrogenase